jgi:hypothetical protein
MIAYALLALAPLVGTARAEYPEELFFSKRFSSFTIPTPAPGSLPPVLGDARLYRIRKGDTLMDLARLYGLGYNELFDAHPGLIPGSRRPAPPSRSVE